jgi:hypothetical protein
MNCTECKELLVEYIEGLLGESQKQAVVEHLKDCRTCQAELKQLMSLHERLVSNGKKVSKSNLEDKVFDRIVREQKARLKAAEKATAALKLRRIIMKSPYVKIAAAAIIIIAVLIGFNPMKPSITIAQVVEPILNAKTMIYDFLVGDEVTSPIIHDIIVGQRIRRTISNMPGMTHIIDLESAQMLVLTDGEKTAAYIDIRGQLGDRTQGYVKFLRQAVTNLKDNYEELGEQEIEGRKTIAFQASGPNEGIKIWADPETALPVRIELGVGQMFVILKNFQFDAPIDDSLMSMDVPTGYTLKEAGFDFTDATEQDFIESLRIWAEVIGDGTFPDAIGTESTMKAMPTLVQKLGEMQVTEEEGTQLGMSFGKGMLFHQILETQGKWQYTGDGVQYGDAEKVVFRYQPKGSQTWRVIYGDLHVEDVAEENLPQ